LQVRVNAPSSIDGSLLLNIAGYNDAYSLQFDGSKYKII